MKGLRWLLVMSALAVAACDGGPKSPDFEPESKVTAVLIVNGNNTEIPALPVPSLPKGTERQFALRATVQTTVPPGYTPASGETVTVVEGKQVVTRQEVVSGASWSSSANTVATVEDGLVKGVATGNAVITGSFEGKSDTQSVTVTDATLSGGEVRCVRPVTTGDPVPACPTTPAGNVYSRPVGLQVPFEAIGVFSDGQPYRIATPPYGVEWSSNQPAVASTASATSNVFTANTVGSATITGTVVSGATPPPVPASASATLNVTAANEFCDTEFRAPVAETATSASPLCLGCSVGTPDLVIDGDLATVAEMSLPLGLLTLSDVSITAANKAGTAQIPAGRPVGFVVSRTSNDILAAALLGSLEVTTVSRNAAGNLVDNDDPATNSEVLRLTLLGIRLPDAPQFLLTTGVTTQPYDGIKLTFRGGLLSLLTAVNVNTACSRLPLPTP